MTNLTSAVLPLVTVIIPARNAEKTIGRALDSALAQDYPTIEIIVVDHGSGDATAEVAAGYRQREVRLLRLPRHHAEAGILNAGITVAKGEYVAFLEAGDEWLPHKLSRQIAALESNPRAVIAVCRGRSVDGFGNVTKEPGVRPPGVAAHRSRRALLAAPGIVKTCVVARAAAFERAGLFEAATRLAADQGMWVRLAMAGEVVFTEEALAIVHEVARPLPAAPGKDEAAGSLPASCRRAVHRRANPPDQDDPGILRIRHPMSGGNADRAGRVWRGGRRLARVMAPGMNTDEDPQPSPRPRPSSGNALLAPATQNLADIPSGPPILIVAVDLEAEFDWSGPRLRTHHSVRNVREQALAHKIFDAFGIRPTYLVDYAAATQANGYGPLREWAASRRCEIGAHLQAWENPPYVEEIEERTSYNHNLPVWLQKEKLRRLTEAICANIAVQPVVYRAGRYGIGEEMAWILRSLGYRIDMSVLPGTDLHRQYGPDFRRTFNRPYWFGRARDLLEIPLTVGFYGLLFSRALPRALTVNLYDQLSRPGMRRLHGPGVFARLGLLERIPLTPEGVSLQEMTRLTRGLLARGHRVLSLNYHSSSLLPGYTPYVRNAGDLDRFLGKIAGYLEIFFGALQGVAMTPGEFHATLFASQCASGNETRAASLAT